MSDALSAAPYWQDDWLSVYQGDCRAVMAELPAESVHCVVTSPPYWGLRDYGTASWEGGDEGCDHKAAMPSRDDAADVQRRKAQYEAEGRSTGQHGGWEARAFRADGKSVCPRCGATRIDSQLGLEATPEEYVANMVAVFREVRRVLRADGTVWLNLGDSYAGNRSYQVPDSKHKDVGNSRGMTVSRRRDNAPIPRSDRLVATAKAKDLVGIPWRVAFALQQPYYAGSIKDERDRIWLAAMLDAEGCLFLHKRKVGQSNGQGYVRKNDSYGAGMEIANTSLAIVERCMAIAGGRGSISRQEKDRRQPLYRWSMRSNECRDVVRELYPHLVAKQHQARLLLGCPSSGPDAEKAHAGLIELHGGGVPAIDFPAPASMFEPGWYVRSDVIWSKLNPMPESVTDRPTKSHEYLFLLSKSARYYYDADAVREPQDSLGRRHEGKSGYRDGHPTEYGFDHRELNPAGRNLRSVWTIATQPYPGAHFATFPAKLVEPCIKAGTSERGVCPECGAPWVRQVLREANPSKWAAGEDLSGGAFDGRTSNPQSSKSMHRNGSDVQGPPAKTLGWQASCPCMADHLDPRYFDGSVPDHDHPRPEPIPATVLDPFAGSGTTGLVAQALGRRAILIDLSTDYLKQIMDRNAQIPLGVA